MIARRYISCKTCGHTHIARIQIGTGPRQEHSFHCSGCKESIRIAVDIDNQNVQLHFHLLDNCIDAAKGEGTPVYLSTELLADKNRVNDELYFPSFDFMNDMIASPDGNKLLMPLRERKYDNIIELWGALKKSWSLRRAGQYQLAYPLIRQFAKEHDLAQGTLRENKWYFVNAIFQMPPNLQTELKLVIEQNRCEFERFLHYYQQNLRDTHRRSQFEILSEYFDAYSQHSQVLTYIRMKAKRMGLGQVTSTDFDKVKGFYARGYEFFSGSICILTCLNNIKEGRPFDKLKNISLTQYLGTDKAKRRDSIVSNNEFMDATSEFDS